MAMNRIHQRLCSSATWARTVEDRLIPWVLKGVDLGDEVLEIGPGYGPTTRVLAERVRSLTAVELDPVLASDLRKDFGGRVAVVEGDGSDLPLPDGAFSGAVCFTMLHHLPSPALQDRLFAEAFRVLRPGGRFAGSDSRLSLRFRLLHIGDTMVAVDPETLPARLEAVGFADVRVTLARKRSFRFTARKPD